MTASGHPNSRNGVLLFADVLSSLWAVYLQIQVDRFLLSFPSLPRFFPPFLKLGSSNSVLYFKNKHQILSRERKEYTKIAAPLNFEEFLVSFLLFSLSLLSSKKLKLHSIDMLSCCEAFLCVSSRDEISGNLK